MTWKETGDKVDKIAAGLLALGIESEQRVGIASGTRVEWIFADLAIMCAGGATTTVYPSTHAEDVAYILSDSECRVVFAEDDEQVAKLKKHKSELPAPREGRGLRRRRRDGDWVITLDELIALGEKHLAEQPRRGHAGHRRDRARPPGHPDLHLRHHRPAQGRAAAPLLVDLRGRRDPGPADPRRERRAVPVAADGALVRQGAALHPARLRLRHRRRRPRGQDHREPRDREADLHGRRAAHLREGPRPHRHDAGRRGRRQGEDLPQGLRGRPQGRRAQARGQVRPAAAEAAARRCSTGWSSPRSATASVDGCGSSSPARPRSTATSPSGSTPPAS